MDPQKQQKQKTAPTLRHLLPPSASLDQQSKTTDLIHSTHRSITQASNYANLTESTVQIDLLDGRIAIGQQKNLKLKRKIAKQTVASIRFKKQQILDTLKEVEEEERKIMQEERINRTLQSKRDPTRKSRQRSFMTQQDGEVLQRLYQQQRRLEFELENKTRRLERQIYQEKKRQLEEERKSLEKKREAKRVEIETKLKTLEVERHKRLQSFKMTEKKLKQQADRKYLFNQYEEKQKEREKQEQETIKKYASEKRKYMIQAMEDIKDHEKRYEDVKHKQDQERVEKIKNLRDKLFSKSNRDQLQEYPVTHFSLLLKSEAERKRFEELRKLEAKEEYHQKIMDYGEMVREKYLPRISPERTNHKSRQHSESTTLATIKSMSVEQLNKKGNEYLQFAKKKKKTTTADIVPQKPITTPESVKHVVHIDYLKQLRSNRRSKTIQHSDEVSQVRKIMSQASGYESIEKARRLIDAWESKAGNNYSKITTSMNAKIQILNSLL